MISREQFETFEMAREAGADMLDVTRLSEQTGLSKAECLEIGEDYRALRLRWNGDQA